jgi:hypothetical protein
VKKFQFIGSILLILSACRAKPTLSPVPTFTPSPTVQVMTSTPLQTPTPAPVGTETTADVPSTAITETLEPCKDAVEVASWLRDDAPYNFNDTNKNKPIPPNGHFTMTWTFKNAGTCTWDGSYQLAFKSGFFFTQEQSYPIIPAGQTVAPGQSAIVNVNMVGASKTGGYQAVWQFQDGKDKSLLSVNIITRIDRGSFKPPTHPVNLASRYVCNAGLGQVRLSWVDTANNEEGYRVYRGGFQVAELDVNTSAFADVVPGAGTYGYTVVAFNVAGEATANISVETPACK